MSEVTAAIDRAHREHWGRLLSLLTGAFRSLEIAEEALADAFTAALDTWPRDGVPDRPEAWLMTVARRRGLDMLRRESTLRTKLPLLVTESTTESVEDAARIEPEAVPDERLRLLFTCCHPALALQTRVALTLRCVGGLSTPEVARAFLVSESTMAARITRAKKKIAGAGIPYRVPAPEDLPERLDGVLAVLYLIFTEGYSASQGEQIQRRELAAEAIRLTRVVRALLPDEAEPQSLLALMLLQHSRRDARIDEHGAPVLLGDQDRRRWHAPEIAEGRELLRRSFSPASTYALQAAIAAEHAGAASAAETDWRRIADLYAHLGRIAPSPVVRLNHAVAVAEVSGPAAGLARLDGLDEQLSGYHLLPAARADLLRRLNRHAEAVAEYDRALASVRTEPDRRFLQHRRAESLAASRDPSPGRAQPVRSADPTS